jgi:hypothetical protein
MIVADRSAREEAQRQASRSMNVADRRALVEA